MSKKKKISHCLCWLNHGTYPGYTMFIYNYSYDFVVKYLKKIKGRDWLIAIKNDPDIFKSDQWLAKKIVFENTRTGKKKNFYIIRIPRKFRFDDWDYCALAHEITHLCQFFLPDILDRNKEIEAEAYFHTHIMGQCLKNMRYKQVTN